MSHKMEHAINALHRAESVWYSPSDNGFWVTKDGNTILFDHDFKFVRYAYAEPLYDKPIGPEMLPGQFYATPIGPKLQRKRKNPDPKEALREVQREMALRGLLPPTEEQYAAVDAVEEARARMGLTPGGMRCRSIYLPKDEQHACANCRKKLPIGGRAFGIGSGSEVVPVCSLGCATDYARASAGGSHHGG